MIKYSYRFLTAFNIFINYLAGMEIDVGSFNLTVGEAVSFDRLNATLNLEDVLCTTFTHVCVRVEPETNALWKISADEDSTDRSCEEISCDDCKYKPTSILFF